MPTLEVARRLAGEFEAAYPDSLADRLAWWAKVLGIRRRSLLRLMGLTLLDVERMNVRPWTEVVRRYSAEARRIEDMLCHLLAQYSYDWKALAEDLRLQKAKKRSIGRGGLSSWRRKHSLIRRVGHGGPNSIELLRDLLSSP